MSLRMLQQHQHAHPIPENDYRARFVRFYEKYNPEKLRDVDDLMQRYSYDLPGVITAMVDKYGPEPGPVGLPKKPPTAAPQQQQQQQPTTPAQQQQQQQQSSAFAARPAGATVVVQPQMQQQSQQPVQVIHAPQQGSTIGNRPIPEHDYRARIVRYYQRYNPEKLSEVDALMQRYSHDLPAVMTAMQKKYGPEPGPVTPAGAPATAAMVSAPQTPLVKVVHRPSTSIVSQDGASPPNVVRVVHRPAPSTVSDHPGSLNTNAAATPLTPHGSVRIVHQATPSNVGQRAIPEHDYRARIVRYYQRYNPEKIAEVDALMQRYNHDLPGVMTAMQKKYGPEPGPVATAAAGGSSVPPSPGLTTGATPPPPTVGPNVKVVHRSVLSSDAAIASGMRPPAAAASAPGTAAGLTAALAAAGSNAGQVQPPQQPVTVQQQRAAPPAAAATAGTTSAGASSSSLQPRRGGFDLEKLRIRGSSSDDDDDDSVSTVLRHPAVPDTPAAAAAAPSQQASPVRGTSSVQSSFASATNATAALLQNNNNSSSQFSDGATKAAGNRSAPPSPTRALSMRTDSDADVMQRESTDGPHRETTTTTKPTPSGSPTKTKAETVPKPLSRNDSTRVSHAGDASGTAASSRAPSSHAEGGGRGSPKKSTAASSATASPTKHQQHTQLHHHSAPASASSKPASPTKKGTTGGDAASPTKHDPSHSSSSAAAHQHQPQQQQQAAPRSILKGTTEAPRATAPPSTETPDQPQQQQQQHQASAPSSKANARKAAAERALAQRRPWVESTKVAQHPPRRWQSQLDEAVSSDDTDQGQGSSKAQQRSGTPPPQRGRTTTPVNRNVTSDQPAVSGAAAATRRTDSAAARRAEYDDHVRRSHSATSATMERQSSRTHSPLTVSSTATGGDDTKRGPRRWVSPAVHRQEQAAEERRMRELRANAIQRYTALVKAGLEDSDLAFVTRQEAMREAHVDPTTFTSPRRTATAGAGHNHSGNVSRQSFASPESVQFVSDGEDDDGNDNDDETDRAHVEIVQHASARRTNAAVTRLMEERETFSFRPNIANPPELREVLGVPRGRERCGVKIGVAVDRHSYIPRTDHTHGDDGFFTAPIVRSSSSSSGPGFNELLVPYDVYSTFKKDTRPSAWALATPPPSMVNKPPHAKKATVMAPVENDPFLPPGVPPVYVSDKPRTEEERAKQAALVHRLSLNKRAQQTLRSHSAEARVIAEQRTQQRRPSPMGRPR